MRILFSNSEYLCFFFLFFHSGHLARDGESLIKESNGSWKDRKYEALHVSYFTSRLAQGISSTALSLNSEKKDISTNFNNLGQKYGKARSIMCQYLLPFFSSSSCVMIETPRELSEGRQTLALGVHVDICITAE